MAEAATAARDPAQDKRGIDRRTLSQRLAEDVREMIFDGALAPGQRLQEADLATHFGVSRTPLREALKALSAEGLVEIEANKGARVSRLSIEELAETFPVMGALEALAGELAAVNARDDEIRDLRALHGEIVRHYQARDLKAYFAANQRFHENLLAAAHNATLSTITTGSRAGCGGRGIRPTCRPGGGRNRCQSTRRSLPRSRRAMAPCWRRSSEPISTTSSRPFATRSTMTGRPDDSDTSNGEAFRPLRSLMVGCMSPCSGQ